MTRGRKREITRWRLGGKVRLFSLCPFIFLHPTCPSTQGFLDPILVPRSPHVLYLFKKSLYGILWASDDIVVHVNYEASFVKYPLSCTTPVHRFKTSLYRAVRTKVLTHVRYVTALVGSKDSRQIRASAEWVIVHPWYAGERSTAGSPGEGQGWGKCPVS